ncbi:MAG: hypothetical protein GEU88_19125 [Solirubrobacterales bacterium]|nr:hypothetical protein [Solirubrobacterales bacterium]
MALATALPLSRVKASARSAPPLKRFAPAWDETGERAFALSLVAESRAIERRCSEDVAFRVICANQIPDHATIARFRVRHEAALADLFGQVLGLCADAGLVEVAVLAVDGSKLEASASNHATRSYEQIAREILAEAGRIDTAEDEIHGEARGDELPEQLTTREGRRAWLREAKDRLERDRAAKPEPVPKEREKRLEICRERLVSDWRAPSAAPTANTRPTARVG